MIDQATFASRFARYWENPHGRFVLKKVDDVESKHLILDCEKRGIVLIDDDEVYAEIVARMIKAGVKIVSTIVSTAPWWSDNSNPM